MEIAYKPTFIRQFKKLPKTLQDEVREKIVLFKDLNNHASLKLYKLHDKLRAYYSFSVNYRYRIVFSWEVATTSAILIAVGDHSVYHD